MRTIRNVAHLRRKGNGRRLPACRYQTEERRLVSRATATVEAPVGRLGWNGPIFVKFPVKFPDSREFRTGDRFAADWLVSHITYGYCGVLSVFVCVEIRPTCPPVTHPPSQWSGSRDAKPRPEARDRASLSGRFSTRHMSSIVLDRRGVRHRPATISVMHDGDVVYVEKVARDAD